jgi:hypothetical protein
MKNWLIAIVVLVLAGAGIWYYLSRTAQPEPAVSPAELAPRQETMTPAESAPTSSTAEQPQAPQSAMGEPEQTAAPLPDLAQSDPLAVDELNQIVGQEDVSEYWNQEGVVSRIVATIDALDSGQVPGVIKAVHGPAGAFEATLVENPETIIHNPQGDPVPQYVLNPDNYARYEPYVEMLEAVTPEQAAALFEKYQPLFQKAYRQVGYSEGLFEDRLVEVIDELLATPTPEGPVRLIKPEAYYLFADPQLESLSAGQKILIRMGSENAARVKSRLAAIRDALRGV